MKMSIMWDLQEEDRTRRQTELKLRKSEGEEEDAERDRGWPDGVKEPFAVVVVERRRELNRDVGSGQTSVLAAVSSVITALITAVNK